MLIDYYATDGTTITPPQFHEGSLAEVKIIARKNAETNFPEWIFGFPITAIIDMADTRILEHLA